MEKLYGLLLGDHSLQIFYLELFVGEPPIPIFVSIVPHFLHIFIRHLSGEVLHDVDKVLLHSIQFEVQLVPI